MRILGIETSCDETAICLIEAEGALLHDMRFRILGNALHSQATTHSLYGGVFPNLAKREHSRNLVPLLKVVFEQDSGNQNANIKMKNENTKSKMGELQAILEREPGLYEQLVGFLKERTRPGIDAIAVTVGPGLEPALWVGVNFARALSAVWNIPIVGVNHMEGHLLVALLQAADSRRLDAEKRRKNSLDTTHYILRTTHFPALALLVSGGHTELVLSRAFRKYERIGETRDDAVGEAFDKVARLLGLPYPGGPHISRLADEARARDEVSPHRISLPRPMMHDPSYDFSFSGLKTAVRRIVELMPLSSRPGLDEFKKGVAREFEDAVTEVLAAKTARAMREFGVKTLVVGGGVSANRHLRAEFQKFSSDAEVFFPDPAYATDNALMIAIAGYFHAREKRFADPETLRADGNLRL